MENEEKKYNGWSNYETWKLALNLDNDEGSYNSVRDRDKEWGCDELKEWLEEFCNEINSEDIQEVGYKLCDFWSFHEWAEIDWLEVAEHINIDIREKLKEQGEKVEAEA